MDGRLAIIFWIASLFGAEDVRQYPTDELSFSTGALQFDGALAGAELRASYYDNRLGRFTTVWDGSITDQGGLWLGYGLYQQFGFNLGQQDYFLGLTFAPGLYIQGGEVDLGLPLEIRSGFEVGTYINDDWRLSLSYDHRSNGDLVALNPGIETIEIRLSRSFGRTR
jgi:lipid A 3-O-deacylase